MCASVCVRACVRACVCVCVYIYIYRERERERELCESVRQREMGVGWTVTYLFGCECLIISAGLPSAIASKNVTIKQIKTVHLCTCNWHFAVMACHLVDKHQTGHSGGCSKTDFLQTISQHPLNAMSGIPRL